MAIYLGVDEYWHIGLWHRLEDFVFLHIVAISAGFAIGVVAISTQAGLNIGIGIDTGLV
jgi:hypothetical protein